jgi:hypothetical protein
MASRQRGELRGRIATLSRCPFRMFERDVPHPKGEDRRADENAERAAKAHTAHALMSCKKHGQTNEDHGCERKSANHNKRVQKWGICIRKSVRDGHSGNVHD